MPEDELRQRRKDKKVIPPSGEHQEVPPSFLSLVTGLAGIDGELLAVDPAHLAPQAGEQESSMLKLLRRLREYTDYQQVHITTFGEVKRTMSAECWRVHLQRSDPHHVLVGMISATSSEEHKDVIHVFGVNPSNGTQAKFSFATLERVNTDQTNPYTLTAMKAMGHAKRPGVEFQSILGSSYTIQSLEMIVLGHFPSPGPRGGPGESLPEAQPFLNAA